MTIWCGKCGARFASVREFREHFHGKDKLAAFRQFMAAHK